MSPSPRRRARSASPATANKVRKKPLRVILNGLGKDAAYIISRINGFTYVQTDYDFYTERAEDRDGNGVLGRRHRRRFAATARTTFSRASRS